MKCHTWINEWIQTLNSKWFLTLDRRSSSLYSDDGSQSGNRRNGPKSTSTHRSFRAQLDPARHLSHLHVRALLHQTLPVARLFLGLSDFLAVRVRGPDSLLPGVPARHQTGRGHDPDHDVPRGHFLQPECVPLQPGDAQWPVPRRGAAGAAQPEVSSAVRESVHVEAQNKICFYYMWPLFLNYFPQFSSVVQPPFNYYFNHNMFAF